MSSFDLFDCTKELSDHAYALWAEAAMLTRLMKENPIPVPLPIVLLIRKSVEVCRLAEVIHRVAQDQRGKSGNHSKSVRRRMQNLENSWRKQIRAESAR